MDGIGQDHVVRLFKGCRNEAFIDEELAICNLTTTSDNTIPLLDTPFEASPTISTYPDPSSGGSTFISTDDALSAFIWKSMTSVRFARLSPNTPSTFARAVDVRTLLSIPSMHPGFVQNMTYNTLTFSELLSVPLGALDAHLRSKVDPKTSTLAHDTRALATLLVRLEDRSCVSFAASLKSTSDIFCSSWVKMGAYEYDFGGVLRRAEAVRRTKSHVTEGSMYLMPKSREREVGLVVCLTEEDMVALRGDGEFARFAEFVG